MNGQISLFDYLDEYENIDIMRPHIHIENAYIAPPPRPKKPQKRKRGNILYRQTKLDKR